MLRTFIRQMHTPERAVLLIRTINLIENAGYLNLIDGLESIIAAEAQATAAEVRMVFETTLGDVIESIYAAHSITASYDDAKLEEITQHLNFLIYFNTPMGYTPQYESEYDLYELGDTPEEILDNLYEESGHNISREPVTWIESVGISFLQRLVECINTPEDDEVTIITGNDLDDLKKFAAIFPDSIAVNHIKRMRGVLSNINELIGQYDKEIYTMTPSVLAQEILGFSIISETPTSVSKADFAKTLVEASAGQGNRAMDVVKALNAVIDKVGVK